MSITDINIYLSDSAFHWVFSFIDFAFRKSPGFWVALY